VVAGTEFSRELLCRDQGPGTVYDQDQAIGFLKIAVP